MAGRLSKCQPKNSFLAPALQSGAVDMDADGGNGDDSGSELKTLGPILALMVKGDDRNRGVGDFVEYDKGCALDD
jgi:hypothetical protein